MPLLLASLILLVAAPAQAGAAPWRWPLERPALVRGFRFDAHHPYAAGAHRVALLRGRVGEPVRAVCTGRSSFAGRLPQGVAGVTLRCGELNATELGITGLAVHRGQVVLAGALLGRLAAGGVLRLGARQGARRLGYRDPLELLGRAGTARTPPPLGIAPRSAPPPPAPPLVSRAGVAHRAGGAHPQLLAVAWLGLGMAGTALGLGLTIGRRRGPRGPVPAVPARAQTSPAHRR